MRRAIVLSLFVACAPSPTLPAPGAASVGSPTVAPSIPAAAGPSSAPAKPPSATPADVARSSAPAVPPSVDPTVVGPSNAPDGGAPEPFCFPPGFPMPEPRACEPPRTRNIALANLFRSRRYPSPVVAKTPSAVPGISIASVYDRSDLATDPVPTRHFLVTTSGKKFDIDEESAVADALAEMCLAPASDRDAIAVAELLYAGSNYRVLGHKEQVGSMPADVAATVSAPAALRVGALYQAAVYVYVQGEDGPGQPSPPEWVDRVCVAYGRGLFAALPKTIWSRSENGRQPVAPSY
jgi:hypothetical protein